MLETLPGPGPLRTCAADVLGNAPAAGDHAGMLRRSAAMAFSGSRGRVTATALIDLSSASRTIPFV